MARSPADILRSIVADVECMQSGREQEGELLFGPFSNSDIDFEGDYGTQRAFVSWPNLEILINEAKAALPPDGE